MEKPKSASSLLIWLAWAVALAVFGAGVYVLARPPHDNFLPISAGSLALIVTALGAALHKAVRSNFIGTRDEWCNPIHERLDQMAILLNLMSEQQLLSDRAKSIAYREKDRSALRRAVQEEMARHDWDAASSLVDEMERAFGIKSEALRLRDEINEHRQELARKQITEVVQMIDKHTRAEQWNAALREADKLMKQFPDNEQVKNLPHEIDNRRLAHKKHLLQNWHEAVARHDNDASIEILKQLDPYLTPVEAAAMQESVRSVFKEKLHDLGAQFAAAIKENRLADAVSVGETIMKDFPNSRIAQEVHDNMTAIKRRLEPAAAGV